MIGRSKGVALVRYRRRYQTMVPTRSLSPLRPHQKTSPISKVTDLRGGSPEAEFLNAFGGNVGQQIAPVIVKSVGYSPECSIALT